MWENKHERPASREDRALVYNPTAEASPNAEAIPRRRQPGEGFILHHHTALVVSWQDSDAL